MEEIHCRNSKGHIVPRYRMICDRLTQPVHIHAMNNGESVSSTYALGENSAQEDAPELIPIPEDWYPIDVLQSLNDDDRLAIFITQKMEEDPLQVTIYPLLLAITYSHFGCC